MIGATQTIPVTTDAAGGFSLSLPNPGESVFTEVLDADGIQRGFAGGQQGTRGSQEAASLYLHRVGPNGKAKTEHLSALQPCGFGGTNRVSGRPLFAGGGPTAKMQAGRWQFQFDTSSRYRTSAKQKIVLRLRVSDSGVVTPGEQTKVGRP
jgi:hypothetical protein